MKPRFIVFVLALLALLTGCSTLVRVQPLGSVTSGDHALAAYAKVLQRFVNDRGEVDFPALAADSKDLETYVAAIGTLRAEDFPNPDERLAHYINSYNALSMYNVVASGIPASHAGYAKVKFFYLRKFLVGGKEMSLYAYENDVIRPLGEPRVHFALNCSALSCPVLPKVPFTGAHIREELEREARKFLNEERNVQLDFKERVAHLNEIMSFYNKDFLDPKTPDLITYVNRYRREPIPEDFTEAFLDYDWTVANSKRKPQ